MEGLIDVEREIDYKLIKIERKRIKLIEFSEKRS
jgi:hypothetical protein